MTNEELAVDTRVAIRNISKRYGGVPALGGVSFDIGPGQIHSLIGENGAGKSTLIKILSGATDAGSGQLSIDGQPFGPHNPREALERGIATVYQDAQIVPDQTVAENIFLGRVPSRHGLVRQRLMEHEAGALLKGLGIGLSVRARTSHLSTAERQMLQIARGASYGSPRLLILDEPTSALTPDEADRLFMLMRSLRSTGVSVLFVSHRLEEVLAVSDTITVLRDGLHVWTRPNRGLDENDLVSAMVGRPGAGGDQVSAPTPVAEREVGPLLIRVEELSGDGFENISLDVHQGEIVGLFGLVGSGRSELLRAIFGATPRRTGRVSVADSALPPGSIPASIRHGLALVPEDRKAQGVVASLSLTRNVSMVALPSMTHWGLLDRKAESRLAQRFTDRLRIKARSLNMPVSSLSGGNQQKVALAKWLAASPRVLMLDEPTAGIDVGAKREIYQLIKDIAADGAGILLVSSEIPEILALSDRVYALREGRLAGSVAHADATPQLLLRLATLPTDELIP